ncbi:MAG: transglutaminase family protein [Magnetococcales bacterium]|nr:transglutaminase family protein [Magnetococcales bacterium]
MAYRVRHITCYQFSEPVSLSHNLAWLQPRHTPSQNPLSFEWTIEPTPAIVFPRLDIHGNRVRYFEVLESHRTLTIECVSQVAVTPPLPLCPGVSPPWEEARDLLNASQDPRYLLERQFLLDSPLVRRTSELARYAAPSFPPRRPLIDGVIDLMHRIHVDFAYRPRATTIATPLSEILAHRHGVCQDFAHVAIGALRSMGLAARYVSGYLETLPPIGRPRLVGADASHAWFATLCPYLGWIDLDPTNDLLPSDRHITLAWGRDYSDVPPLKGVVLGGGRNPILDVSVDVQRDTPFPESDFR